MKRTASVLAATTIVFALSGCVASGEPGETSSPQAGCDGAEIAYITSATSIAFWRSLSLGISDAASAAGATVTVYDSDNSQSKQLQNAQDAITRGVDAIVLSPTDSASAPAVLELAATAGVPVVIADIGTDSGEYLAFVKTDNVAAATTAGEYLVERLSAAGYDTGEIGMIGISQSRQNGKDRTAGFSEPITEAGFTIAPLLESADYTRSESLGFTQDLLAATPDMIGLFTQHDEATQGAVTALDGATLPIVVGFDGSPDTLQAIKDGSVAGAAMQQPVLMGKEALGAVCSHLEGNDVEKTIFVDTIMVTTENVKDIEADVLENVFKE